MRETVAAARAPGAGNRRSLVESSKSRALVSSKDLSSKIFGLVYNVSKMAGEQVLLFAPHELHTLMYNFTYRKMTGDT